MQEIKPILVPQYEELTADKMYAKVKGYIANLADYFPDYDESYIPPGNTFGISSQLLIKNLQRSLLIIPSRKETSKK